MDLLKDLKSYFRNLESYQRLLEYEKERTKARERCIESMRKKLIGDTAKLKSKIIELTNKQYMVLFGNDYDIWNEAFNPVPYLPRQLSALRFCIDATIEAISKLEEGESRPIERPETIKKADKEPSNKIFDAMQFHPRIIKASKSLFNSEHYAEAIFAAFKAVNNFTRRKAGQSLDGKDLMAKVFSEDKPIIKINKLTTQSERNEQEGFRFLFMGAMVGIRNPKAHDGIRQIDPYKTLEYLAFASLLMRRVTEGKLEPKEQTP